MWSEWREGKAKTMKKTLTATDIRNDLLQDEDAAWTAAGAQAIAEYLIKLDEDCGMDSEYDRVSVRCDFSEHASLQAWAEGYLCADEWACLVKEHSDGDGLDEDGLNDRIRDYITDKGHLIEFDGGVIVSSF